MQETGRKTGREAGYFERLEGGAIRCALCRHGCLLKPGKSGFCGVRKNREGVLHSLVYGLVAAEAADPVEKKPLYQTTIIPPFSPKDTFSPPMFSS